MASPTRSPQPRLRLKFALGVGCWMAVLGGALAWLLTQTSAIAAHVASQVLPRVSKELGCDIRVGGIEGRLFPAPSVSISDLAVCGKAGEPALLAARQARANVLVWPLIRSFGQEVRVSSVVVEQVTLSVVTRPDGSSNLGKLVSFWAARARRQTAWEFDTAALRSARMVVFDLTQSAQPRVTLDAFEADFAPTSPATLAVRARLASDRPNNLSAQFALQGGALRGTFAATELDLGRLKPALPPGSAELLAGGQLATQGQITSDPQGVWVVTGRGQLDGQAMGNQAIKAAFELRTTVDLGPSQPAPIELSPVNADRFVLGRLELSDLRARAMVTRDSIRVEALTAKLAGGSVAVSEARLDLSKKELPWTLRATAAELDLAELGRALDLKLPVVGKSSASFDVAGAGVDWTSISRAVAGTGRFNLDRVTVSAATGAMLTRTIRNTLNTFAMGGLFPELGAMPVGPFGASFHVGQGVIRLDEPVALRAQIGEAVLGGTVGLDQKLALVGTATLRWNPIAGMKAHAATVPIAIRGTLSNPVAEVTATPVQLVGAIAGAAPTLADIQAEARRRLRTWLKP